MKQVFLVEYIWSGHNVGYFHMLAQLFRQAGCKVIALVPDASAAEAINALANPNYQAHQHQISVPEKYRWQNWQPITEACREAEKKFGKADLVFIPYLDNLLFPTGQQLPWFKERWFQHLFPYRWAGLYFHPGYQPYRTSEQMLAYKKCMGVGILNPLDRERIVKQIPDAHVLAFPDFAEFTLANSETPLLKDIKQRAAGRPIIASLGVQARRKGLITLLDLAQLPGAENYFFFIGGEVRDHTLERYEQNRIEALAANPPANLWLYNQKIESEEVYNRILADADVVYVGYQNFPSSSNTLTKAAYFGKPILASQDDYIGWATQQYDLGTTFNAYDPAVGLLALKNLLANTGAYPNQGQAAFLDVNSMNAAAAFAQTLLARL